MTPPGASLLRLHPGQREVFDAEQRFKVVVAGRRWGKTQTAKLEILSAAAKSKQLIWYVAPTYQMARGILWDELKDSIPRAWIVSINETRMTIRLLNGTRIELKGADKPDTLRGVGLHVLIIDEAQDIKVDTWTKVLRPTLASTRGRAIIIGTPKAFNWLYDVYMLGQRGDVYDKNGIKRINTWKSWQFKTIDSPFIPREEVEAARSDMDEKSFRQEFEASFEAMSGRVYYAFDRKTHVGNYPFNPRLPIKIGMDFNIDPMSSVIMQEQPNGEVWIVDEIILAGSNTSEMADEMERRYYRWIKGITLYPDPAGASGSTKGRGLSDLDILASKGFRRWKHKRKHPKIADRVNAVNRMFKAGDGTIRMRVNHTCKHSISAFEETIYKPGTREVDKSAGKEHPADGVGYFVDIEYPAFKRMMAGLSL
jgi:hypothetical protein